MHKLGALFALLAGIGLATPPAEAVVLKFQPSAATVNVGDDVTIDMLADIGDDEPVIGFDLNVGFDPSIASLVNVAFGSAWDPVGSFWDGGTWLLGIAPYDFDAFAQTVVTGDDVLLASLTFSGDAKGITEVTALLDGLTNGFYLLPTDDDPFPVVGAEVTPGSLQAVPEPATLALLLPGLVGVGLLAWRRQPA
jgi:hypothetical protein